MATPLHDLLRSITSEPSIRSEFVAAPDRFLADHGWDDLSGLDAITALGALMDEAPLDEAIPLAAAIGGGTDQNGADLLAELAINLDVTALDATAPDHPGEESEALEPDLDGDDPIHLDDAIDLDDPTDLDDPADLDDPVDVDAPAAEPWAASDPPDRSWADDNGLPSTFGGTPEPPPAPPAREPSTEAEPTTDDPDTDPASWADTGPISDGTEIPDDPTELDSPSLVDESPDPTQPWAEDDPDHLEA